MTTDEYGLAWDDIDEAVYESFGEVELEQPVETFDEDKARAAQGPNAPDTAAILSDVLTNTQLLADLYADDEFSFLDVEERTEAPKSRELEFDLLHHQEEFVNDTATAEIAMVSGMGAGKSEGLVHKALALALINAKYQMPAIRNIIAAPNARQVAGMLAPQLKKILENYGVPHAERKSPHHIFQLYLAEGTVNIMMVGLGGNDMKLRGLECNFILVDEVDTLPTDKAVEIYNTLVSRLRGAKPGATYQMCFTSTPEGRKWLYEHFVEALEDNPDLAKTRRLIKARTADNPFLPASFIPNLQAAYPKALINAYLNGEFVTLNGNLVYTGFDIRESDAPLTLADIDPKEVLRIGIDFNTLGMAAVTVVERGDMLYVVDEICGDRGTPELIKRIMERYKNRIAVLYPDAAGKQRNTVTEDTNLILLERSGFVVDIRSKNPRVQDRVNSVNAQFLDGSGKRRLLVNTKTCPLLTKALGIQKYDKNSAPEKGEYLRVAGANALMVDGVLDALGYCIYTMRPIDRDKVAMMRMSGF